MKKRKLLYCACIALILSLSFSILAAAACMNRNSSHDLKPRDVITDIQTEMQNDPAESTVESNTGIADTPLTPENSNGNGIVTDNVTNENGNMTPVPDQTESSPTTTEGMMDEMIPDTNVPDADIGGAVGDNDGDSVPDAVDSDDDNDGVKDPIDSDANGDGTDDTEKTTGIIGIVIAVAAVVAVILVIIAVVPKKPKDS